jgi:hypothetical protein
MQVEPRDGRCRRCGGTLTIVDADDISMTVTCNCGEEYLVEHDAFGGGGVHYVIEFLAGRLGGGEP